MRTGEQLVVKPYAIDLDGRGFAAIDGRRLTVPDLFVGERARVEIEHVSRGGPVAFARVMHREVELEARREIPCPRHASLTAGRCTGCPLMVLDDAAQRSQKLSMLAHLGLKIEDIHAGHDALGYRWASKRVAFWTDPAGLTLGSFVRGTHRRANMAGCIVDHPAITKAADVLVDIARARSLRPWEPRRPRGLRYVWLKTDGEHVLMTLVWGDEATSEQARGLAEALPTNISVALSVQDGANNDLRGSSSTALRGRETLDVTMGGGVIPVGPLGFLQPNPEVVTRMIDDLLRDEQGEILHGKLAFDLYAGSGTTTRRLSDSFDEVRPCESYPESAAAVGIKPVRAEDFLRDTSDVPQLIIANPPRKGLGEVAAGLVASGSPRVHLMACGPKALARDLEILGEAYELVALHAWDTLPQTPHVELIAKLVRR